MVAINTKKADSASNERPPIVVIMGHVDHGKSTLLDFIRKTNIVESEAGGITQHISAYEVIHKDAKKGGEKKITFLDTPGHAAFQSMRSRGARVADIAVLVVSAEDGVKAQTIEAHKAIMDAKVPYIVAINKIDKPNANVERTKQTLAESEIYIEGYGGDVPFVPISAKSGEGVSELLDMILLLAEINELVGDASVPAEGVIIESKMDPKRGIVATLVITNGTLKKGMFVATEGAMTPVRSIENFLGKQIDEATFSTPIRLTGWSTLPGVGASFMSCSDKKTAETAVATGECRPKAPFVRDELPADGVLFPIILRADVAGSLEALLDEIAKLSHERVILKVIQSGVGAVNESDIKLAFGSNDPVRRAPHVESEEILGEFRIIRYFSQQKNLQVVGGKVTAGKMVHGARFKIMRRDVEIGEGKIVELQSQKIKVSEVLEGNECGLQIESKFTLAERDVLIPYIVVKKQ
ncbi:MAG: Translation initiation factor IF-2 protein [Parcubacteria group bacterium GW2011_GWA2_47_7]|nr:MAG: Translation initiation factor IF-2 protein [Parcubacteria group bacterium GW2011_GWA2_47_7]